MNQIRLQAHIGVTILVLATSVEASFTTFQNEASFLNTVNSPSLESFETLGNPNVLLPSVVTPSFTVSSGQGIVMYDIGGVVTEGVQYIVPGATLTQPSGTVIFNNFAVPITSFGINIGDFGDVGVGTLTMRVVDTGDSFLIASAPLLSDNTLFFGIIGTGSFTSIELISTTVNDGIQLDEIYFTSVPEPTTAATFCFMAFGFGVLRKYTRRVAT